MLADNQMLSLAAPTTEGVHPISHFKSGQKITLVAITGEQALKGRLSAMGVKAGKQVQLLKNIRHSVILKVENTRIALRLNQLNIQAQSTH